MQGLPAALPAEAPQPSLAPRPGLEHLPSQGPATSPRAPASPSPAVQQLSPPGRVEQQPQGPPRTRTATRSGAWRAAPCCPSPRAAPQPRLWPHPAPSGAPPCPTARLSGWQPLAPTGDLPCPSPLPPGPWPRPRSLPHPAPTGGLPRAKPPLGSLQSPAPTGAPLCCSPHAGRLQQCHLSASPPHICRPTLPRHSSLQRPARRPSSCRAPQVLQRRLGLQGGLLLGYSRRPSQGHLQLRPPQARPDAHQRLG